MDGGGEVDSRRLEEQAAAESAAEIGAPLDVSAFFGKNPKHGDIDPANPLSYMGATKPGDAVIETPDIKHKSDVARAFQSKFHFERRLEMIQKLYRADQVLLGLGFIMGVVSIAHPATLRPGIIVAMSSMVIMVVLAICQTITKAKLASI